MNNDEKLLANTFFNEKEFELLIIVCQLSKWKLLLPKIIWLLKIFF
jgi:hypothetical protein